MAQIKATAPAMMNCWIPIVFLIFNSTCSSFSTRSIIKQSEFSRKRTSLPTSAAKRIKKVCHPLHMLDDLNAAATDETKAAMDDLSVNEYLSNPSKKIFENTKNNTQTETKNNLTLVGDKVLMDEEAEMFNIDTNNILSEESNTKNNKRKRLYPTFAYPNDFGKTDVNKKSLASIIFGIQGNDLNLKDLYYYDRTNRDLLIKSLLQRSRSYARSEPFLSANAALPPIFSDLVLPPAESVYPLNMSGPVYRTSIFAAAYFSFPYITEFFREIVSVDLDKLSHITNSVIPGIAFCYGSFLTFTFYNLFRRQNDAQKIASKESATMSNIAQGVLMLLEGDRNLSVKACQALADQTNILVRKSRGEEIMTIIYSDPYARLMAVLAELGQKLEKEKNGKKLSKIGPLQERISGLMVKRSERLCVEGMSLPPIYFAFIRVLTIFLIVGFIFSNLGTIQVGKPSWESTFIFSVLCSVYIKFNTFVLDLDTLFEGLYQIRRSTIAGHLLHIKWLISRQPFGDEIDFDDIHQERIEEGGSYFIDTPGLGNVLITDAVDAR